MDKTNKNKGKGIILLVHGILTHAWWQREVKDLIENATGHTVIPLKYGYFDLLRFWCPFDLCRQGPINRLHKELRNTINQFRDRPISVIAHSYGTYALSRILLEHDDIKLRRIVLCGSVIPNSFNWARLASQIQSKEMRMSILNECGTKDIWPALAKSTTWGYGSSGTHGFGSVQVTDRFHAMPHSGYFDKKFVKKFWLPFITSGEVVTSTVQHMETDTPLWLLLPYKWLIATSIALAIAAVFWSFVLPKTAKDGVCNALAHGGVAACGDIRADKITIKN